MNDYHRGVIVTIKQMCSWSKGDRIEVKQSQYGIILIPLTISFGKSSGHLSVYNCMLLAASVSQEKETSFHCSKETLLYIFITFNIKMYNRLMMQGATGEI